MKKIVLVLILLLILPVISFAISSKADEALTPGDTATGITSTIRTISGQQARGALITVEDNSIMFCLDGTTPTAAAGTNKCHRMDSGQSYYIDNPSDVINFKCIDRVSGSASKVKVTTFFE